MSEEREDLLQQLEKLYDLLVQASNLHARLFRPPVNPFYDEIIAVLTAIQLIREQAQK